MAFDSYSQQAIVVAQLTHGDIVVLILRFGPTSVYIEQPATCFTGKLIRKSPVGCVSWMPNGRHLMTASCTDETGTV